MRKKGRLPRGYLAAARLDNRTVIIQARPSRGESKKAFIARVMAAFNAMNK